MGQGAKRHDLENLAYGEGTEPAERSAALRELAALAGGRRRSGRSARSAPAVPAADEVEQDPDEADLDPSQTLVRAASPRRRRITGAALLAAALVVGVVAGSVVTAQLAARSTVAAGNASVSSSTDPDNQAQVLAGPDPLARANALFGTTQDVADTYPTTFDLDGAVVPSSTRFVGMAGSTVRIFIARQSGSSTGFCILSATVLTTGPQSSGSATCTSADKFRSHGIVLAEGTFTVTWLGSSITIEIAHAT